MQEKSYIVVVQCDIVMERCSGFLCEHAFNNRTGGFASYAPEKPYRTLYVTCGGCCGRAVHRKLSDLVRMLKKVEKVSKKEIVVHLASCITKDNYHALPCPHLDYLKSLIRNKLSLDLVEDTYISENSETLRRKGTYRQ
ncbi:MAG: CGGC domain-containing protein [Deltaproteobacteria bacterium]|jgi:predicted metal-binding protein|nr:CGGC domain-containing protein [Deltaproteobacteria bacterium]